MSFRKRLTLFFVVIVVVPMLAVALVLYLLIADSQSAKALSRVTAAQTAAAHLYRVDQHDARVRGEILKIFGGSGGRPPGDQVLLTALAAGNGPGARRRAAQLARRDGIMRLTIYSDAAAPIVDYGSRTAVAPDTGKLVVPGQGRLKLELSMRSAAGYARIASRIAGASVLVTSGGRLLALAPEVPDKDLIKPSAVASARAASLAAALAPEAGRLRPGKTIAISGNRYAVASVGSNGFRGQDIKISILVRSVSGSVVAHTRLLTALILGGLLALAVTLALLVSRSLQDQIANFLGAAQRLGKGDLATRVPVSGRDEFAALGEEFNSMASQLENRLEELRQQRRRLQRSLQRLGDSFASNLDRDAILGIVLRTAVDGSGARAGRASARTSSGDRLTEAARVGPTGEYDGAMTKAEEDALRSGDSGICRKGQTSALAHVLRGSDGSSGVLGVISVARGDREFEDGERELFAYLARQAGVSVENVGLHEQVQRQAVTDELTGLFNHRRFVEALESEAERARRFDQPVGLVMLDLDDFKAVNDTYGHQQGDEVLRQVAELMRSYSREIDAPARYGGEELAIVLPQTDLTGATRLAERLRAGIEQLAIPLLSGAGTMRVTASIGVAALPESAGDVERLIAVADAALYEAKRGGKNKTVEAR
ncbi:MAG: two-component system, cell cycle response regulator [Solirubrobacteraceae bacterium]|jgi:diguanylate cyclase (GGDEF)-like protein|nr:two-component system, cell cycle response regulator [Solirubrobacteraceae bacterium]